MQNKIGRSFGKILIIVLILVAIVFGILYIVFPNLFFQRNLGVEVTTKSYASAIEKLNYTLEYSKEEVKEGTTYDDYIHTYGEVQKIDESFTSEEITSFINMDRPDYFAAKNVQVLINDDNSVSVSANVNVNAILQAVDGLPAEYKNKDNLPVNFLIPENANVYVRFTGQIEDNKVTNLNIIELEVVGYDVLHYINGNMSIIVNELNDQLAYLHELTGSYVDSLSFANNNMLFIGDFPSSLKIEIK